MVLFSLQHGHGHGVGKTTRDRSVVLPSLIELHKVLSPRACRWINFATTTSFIS